MARFVSDGFHIPIRAGAGGQPSGVLVQLADLAALVEQSPNGGDWPEGDLGTVRTTGIIELENSGVVFAYGAGVGYAVAGNNAVAAGGGNFDCGICVNPDGAAATDPVRVLLNAPFTPPGP